MPILKLLSILVVANLFGHNNISKIYFAVKFHYSATVNSNISNNLTPLEVTFILLAMVPNCNNKAVAIEI